jgi:hypothetical protein
MTGPRFFKAAERMIDDVRLRALTCGFLLGWISWELSNTGEPSAYRVAMTLVMLVSGSLSFTFYAVHSNQKNSRRSQDKIGLWLVLLGAGVVTAITALDVLMA